ncbi:MAG: hypothetical protein IKS31_10550 [Clostridia bacterium]|nr:hypothetical protein [Clostridia bacterium]
MPKVSEAARRETLWVAAWTAGLCLVMHLVFILLKKWGIPVLLGSLLGSATAVGTFFWLAMTVQKAVGKPEKVARGILQRSQVSRLLIQGAVLAAGFAVSWLDGFATMIPLFFPHIAVRLRPLWKKGMQSETPNPPDGGDMLD